MPTPTPRHIVPENHIIANITLYTVLGLLVFYIKLTQLLRFLVHSTGWTW